MTMFSPEEIDSICSITASLLHLGNIMFVNDPEKEVVDIANRPVLGTAAKILGIEADDLSDPLVKRSNVIRGERIFSPLRPRTHATPSPRRSTASSLRIFLQRSTRSFAGQGTQVYWGPRHLWVRELPEEQPGAILHQPCQRAAPGLFQR